MRRIGWFLLFAACTGTDTGDDTGDTQDTEDTDTDSGPGPEGQAHGTVVDGDGVAVQDAKVNLCRLVCTTVTTDAVGAFTFGPLEIGDYAFHVVPPVGSDLSEPVVPFTIEEYADPAIAVVLPPLGAEVALPATRASIEAAPGLFLTLGQGDLEVLFEDAPTHVAGVRVDAADYLPLDVTGDVIAVWYLDPYEAVAAEGVAGIPIAFRNDFGLADGTYEAWRASYWDYAFVKVGDVTVTGGAFAASAATIPELTTIVLVDPPEGPDPYAAGTGY